MDRLEEWKKFVESFSEKNLMVPSDTMYLFLKKTIPTDCTEKQYTEAIQYICSSLNF